MLEGLLVDLVPFSKRFMDRQHEWRNSEAQFWASMGERFFVTRAMVERRQQRHAEDGPQPEVHFGIQAKDGTPLGYFGINWMVPHQRLGMLGANIVDPAYWGGGYGTDGLLLIVDYAFDWLDLRKVWLMTMSANVRVMRQMEKVGFRLEVRQREATTVDGQWADALAYGMQREEWPGRAEMIVRLGLRAK